MERRGQRTEASPAQQTGTFRVGPELLKNSSSLPCLGRPRRLSVYECCISALMFPRLLTTSSSSPSHAAVLLIPPVSLSSGARASASPSPINFPSKAELLACLPLELLSFKPAKAWGSLFMSLSLSLVAYGLGSKIPLLPPDTHRRPTLVALRAGHGNRGGRLLGDRPCVRSWCFPS